MSDQQTTCPAKNCTAPANLPGTDGVGSTLCRRHEARVLATTTLAERRAVLREMGDEGADGR